DFLRVGVFVDPDKASLTEIAPLLDVAQIYGDGETSLPLWRAMVPGGIPPADARVQAWLLDSVTPAFGGSGKAFNWSLAAGLSHRVIVAGGLDGDNVAEAIRIANPWGVDSCSRLESSPGKKDHARVA